MDGRFVYELHATETAVWHMTVHLDNHPLYLATDTTTPGDDNRPIAALPLVASDELLGMLVIYKLLIQKDGFEPIDMELFDLLAGHAATALRAAQLYARSQRRASTLEGFLQILKDSPVEESPEES